MLVVLLFYNIKKIELPSLKLIPPNLPLKREEHRESTTIINFTASPTFIKGDLGGF